jgi:hypothetical protein
MDWNALGAIGETVGAIAVVATLFYFSVQIRRNRTELFSGLASSAQQFEFTLRDKLESSSELICKANSGADLNDEEAFRLRQITAMVNARYFYQFVRIIEMNESTNVVVRHLAILLLENPGLETDWLRHLEHFPDEFGDIEEGRGTRWIDEVKRDIEKLRFRRSG